MTPARLEQRAAMFDDVVDLAAEPVVDKLGLGSERGPHRLDEREPSEEATKLACLLLERSLPALRTKLCELGGTMTLGRSELRVSADEQWEIDWTAARYGLALLGTCCPEARYRAARLRAFTQLSVHNERERDELLRLVSAFLIHEENLWDLAAGAGASSRQIPYAHRFSALEWFWDPRAHREQHAFTLCIRCGRFLLRERQKTSGSPRCPECAKEPPGARVWPTHAIAPAGVGTWWLKCQNSGCSNAFEARAQARRCPRCRSSRLTPSRRLRA